jgi:hypothetical protein
MWKEKQNSFLRVHDPQDERIRAVELPLPKPGVIEVPCQEAFGRGAWCKKIDVFLVPTGIMRGLSSSFCLAITSSSLKRPFHSLIAGWLPRELM